MCVCVPGCAGGGGHSRCCRDGRAGQGLPVRGQEEKGSCHTAGPHREIPTEAD